MYFAPHHARARAILLEAYGETGYTIAAQLLHAVAGQLGSCEPDAVERGVEVELARSASLGGYQNPLDGRDLRVSPLVVRVGYRYAPEGDLDASVDAARLGGADRRSIEERASEDAATILAAVGWQPNWASLDPVVIDCAPDGDGWAIDFADDRALLTIPFTLTTRAAFPGTRGPAAT